MRSKNKKTYCKSQQRYPVVEPDYGFVKILDKYRDKYGFRVFIGEDRSGKILIDINKVIYRHNRKGIYWNRYCDCELLFIFHTDGVSKYVFDPTELGENLWILFKYKNSSRVRRWVLKRLNAVFVGSDGKTIGDFCTWNKHVYPVYDLTKLNEEVEKSFEKINKS